MSATIRKDKGTSSIHILSNFMITWFIIVYNSIASKYRGVYKSGLKWKAQIQVGGVQHYLGVFETGSNLALQLSYDTLKLM